MGILEVGREPAPASSWQRSQTRASANADVLDSRPTAALRNRIAPLGRSDCNCCSPLRPLAEESEGDVGPTPDLDPDRVTPEFQGYARLQ
eukprot:3429128-Alexandrium_andersonii.AAC.1